MTPAPPLPPPPPRNARFLPGARLFRRALWFAVAVCWAIFGTVGVREAWTAYEHESGRREATGTVTATSTKQVRSGKGGSRTLYLIDFTFADEAGAVYNGNSSVPSEKYPELKPGSPVPVIYQANDPGAVQWLYSDADHRDSLGRAWRGPLFGLLMVLGVVAVMDWHIRWERTFARTAVAAHGTVIEVKEQTGNKGSKSWAVTYEFRTPGLETRAGRAMIAVRSQVEGLQPGVPVVVLFDPVRPRRNRLLQGLLYVDPESVVGCPGS